MKKLFSTPGVKGVCICVILFLIMVAFLSRPILVLYHQQQAGKIIDQVSSNIEASDLISYRCFLGQLLDEPPTEMNEAIIHLLTAKKFQEKNAHTVYLLGQAYCLNKDFDKAIRIFNYAQVLKENNPNYYIETGFAYQALAYEALNSYDNDLVDDIISKTKQNLQRGQINFDSLTPLANEFFVKGEFEGAYLIYWLAKDYQTLSAIQDLRIFLINKVLDREFPLPVSNIDIPVLNIDKNLLIAPNEMFSLNEAKKISHQEIDARLFGVMWSNKSDAVTLVDFSESGDYVFEIQLLDRSPAPTRLLLSIDFQPVLEIELPNGDDQLMTFDIDTFLTKGVHLLSVKLLNDAIINGEDRNGYINQIIIIKN